VGRRLVLGVDSSTQSTKVEARDLETGELVARGAAPHPATSPPVSEQDPASWWEALRAAVAAIGDHRRDVVAMSVAGQQHGLVIVDDAGATIRPAKLWNDTTSAPQASRLVERLGASAWADATGSVPVASFTVTKLAWLAEHEPDSVRRIARVMLPHDWITWRLTGEHVTDRGDASGTGWFDPSTDENRPDLLALAVDVVGVDALPRVAAPFETIGRIRPEVSESLGLPADVVVGPGTGDNMAAALGLGLRPSDVAISLGTSGTAFAVSAAPTHDPSGSVAGFASACGNFLPLVCTLNATKVTDTVARWLGHDARSLAELALGAMEDPGTVSLVPYFDGERTPNLPDATGTMSGLTNSTTVAQIALAAHDGVLRGLLDGVDALARAGATVSGRLFLVGGGARSTAYRRRAADLSGRSVIVPDADESVAMGAAVQAALTLSGPADIADSIDDLSRRWHLGAGTDIVPLFDAREQRSRHSHR